jgi:hypothetical protein
MSFLRSVSDRLCGLLLRLQIDLHFVTIVPTLPGDMKIVELFKKLPKNPTRTTIYAFASAFFLHLSVYFANVVRALPGGSEPDRWREGVQRYSATFPEIIMSIIAVIMLIIGMVFAVNTLIRVINYREYNGNY